MRIGIVAREIKDVHGISLPYARFFSTEYKDSEIIPLPININPDTFDHYLKFLDLIVLVGGADVDPKRYNEKKSYWTGAPDYYLEYFDLAILPIAIKARVPIFGICRGFQTLNVHFGGKLQQHIKNHKSSFQNRGSIAHDVFYWKNNKKYVIGVNSLHHQGIELQMLAKNLQRVAHYSKDTKNGVTVDLVEAFHHKNLPIAGVQWHPEELNGDEVTKLLLERIL